MTATSEPAAEPSGELERPVDAIDILMLLLAIISVVLLVYVTFIDPDRFDMMLVFAVDAAVCGVFLVEFLWRWRKVGWQRSYPLRRWYEVLGMIPIAHPALRSLRLLRVVVIAVRLGRMANRVLGEKVTRKLVDRLTDPIVEAVKRPIIVLTVDEVVRVIEGGNIPRGISDALRENSDDLQEMVVQKIKNDPTAGRFRHLPFHDQIVESVVETSLRVILEVLADPRVDEFVTDVIQENHRHIREAVRRRLDSDEERTVVEQEPAAVTGR